MNTGQTILTIAASFLLAVLILRTNRVFLSTSSVMMDSKFGVLAVSIATSVIEEANSLAFDEATDTTSVYNLNDLTNPNLLGPEVGETYEYYDDFDDFNGFFKVDSTMPSAVYNIGCKVNYVNVNTLDIPSSARTWSKKITVEISSPSMVDTIRMSSVYSYWFFR